MGHKASVPSSPGEVTPEWLTGILHSIGVLTTGRVTAVRPTSLARSTGLMSAIVRLSLDYNTHEPGIPSSLIAKFPPDTSESHRTGMDLGFFEGECGFYGELARNSNIPAPRCYFTRYDAVSGLFLTLLQDLSFARLGEMSAGCTREEAARAIEVLARFHASWWNSDALALHGWLRSRAGRLTEYSALMPAAWQTFATRFRDVFEPENLATLSRAQALLGASTEALLGGPQVLLHGDFKLDNMFFHSSGEITVADWGLVMTGPPMFDVATFLGINLPVAERRAHEVELIRVYVESLADSGVSGYDSDRAFRDYKVQLCGLLPQFICAGGLAAFADVEAIEEYAEGVQRVLVAIADLKAIDALLT